MRYKKKKPDQQLESHPGEPRKRFEKLSSETRRRFKRLGLKPEEVERSIRWARESAKDT
jgi:hypothetical protein